DDPFTTGKCRFDVGGEVVVARGHEQQGFSGGVPGIDGAADHQPTDSLAAFAAAGLAGDEHGDAGRLEAGSQQFGLRRFTGSLAAFQRDEARLHHSPPNRLPIRRGIRAKKPNFSTSSAATSFTSRVSPLARVTRNVPT